MLPFKCRLVRLQVTVNRVHIQYEDGVTDAMHPLTLGVVVDSVQLLPCDLACCAARLSGTLASSHSSPTLAAVSPRLRHHTVHWHGLAVYLNPGSMLSIALTGGQPADGPNWTGLNLDKIQVVLAPVNGKLSIARACSYGYLKACVP